MFDNVTLKMYSLPQSYTLGERLENIYKCDTNTYKGRIKNMSIRQNNNCLIIYGSLAKYLRGENITPLNREDVKAVIEKLEQDIDISIC